MGKLRLLGAVFVTLLSILPLALALECDNLFSPACLDDESGIKDKEIWQGLARYGVFFSINYWIYNILKKLYGGWI